MISLVLAALVACSTETAATTEPIQTPVVEVAPSTPVTTEAAPVVEVPATTTPTVTEASTTTSATSGTTK